MPSNIFQRIKLQTQDDKYSCLMLEVPINESLRLIGDNKIYKTKFLYLIQLIKKIW
jgi:hypothetical protein